MLAILHSIKTVEKSDISKATVIYTVAFFSFLQSVDFLFKVPKFLAKTVKKSMAKVIKVWYNFKLVYDVIFILCFSNISKAYCLEKGPL